jgi:hypothetical protein
LLREAVAKAQYDIGVVLRAGLVVAAAELIRAGYAVARDEDRGIEM